MDHRKEESLLSSPIKRLDQRSPYMEKSPIKAIFQGQALSPFNRSRKDTADEEMGKVGSNRRERPVWVKEDK